MVTSYLKHGNRMFVKRNTVIYEQGTIGGGLYLLVDGKIKISMKVFDGKERIIGIQGNGQILGEQSMDRDPYFSSASTLEDSVLYYFEYRKFQELIIKDHVVRDMFYNSMIYKLKILSDIIQLKSLSVEKQLAKSLLEISHKYNSCEIPLNQQQLSNYTGLTRITIYKIIKEWKETQLIKNHKGKIIIKNRDVLQKIVEAF